LPWEIKLTLHIPATVAALNGALPEAVFVAAARLADSAFCARACGFTLGLSEDERGLDLAGIPASIVDHGSKNRDKGTAVQDVKRREGAALEAKGKAHLSGS
jgi:hypothetical protein